MTLTENQREAVESWNRGDVCVVAGPGSGKTRVLVERFRWLVENKNIDPGLILAITFTEKAAKNMHEQLMRPVADVALRQDYERAQISTIDAFCARLLREHALDVGVDPDFRILDRWEADLELRRVIAEVLDAAYAEDPAAVQTFLHCFESAGDQAEDSQLSNVHKQVFRLHETIRVHGGKPFAQTSDAEGDPHEGPRNWLTTAVERAARRFREWKREAGALDFTDLEEQAIRILEESPGLGARFQHILIDELQDINLVQARLLELLRGDSKKDGRVLFAVGDINQAIYGFRYADPQVFRDYRDEVRDRQGHLVELRENFRSRPEVLRVVETMLSGEPGVEPHELVAGLAFPSKKIPSVEVLIARGRDADSAKEKEARHIAARMIDLRGSLRLDNPPRFAEWNDFAVLLRTHNLATRFATALRDAGIPCRLSAGRGFFDSPEVRDMVHLLRVLRNPRDEISLAAVLCSPLVGISDETLLRLKLHSDVLARGLESAAGAGIEEQERLARFRELLERYRATRDDMSPDLLLSRVVAETGYEAYLLSTGNGSHQAANIRKLILFARQVSQGRPPRFDEFLERLDAVEASGIDEPEAAAAEESSNAVQVMTLHKAKGLEFPVVFLPALQSRSRVDSGPVGYDPRLGIGAKWLDPVSGDSISDPALEAVNQQRRERESEENARLFYVGMTRAQEHLVLGASYGASARAVHWSKHLRDRLQVDLKPTDSEPIVQEVKGCALRVWRTDQDPVLRPTLVLSERQREPIWVDPARPQDQSDSVAAVTSVALYAQCPRRYYLSRYLGFEPPAKKPRRDRTAVAAAEDVPREADETDATDLGRRVHEILAGSRSAEEPSSPAMELVANFQNSDWSRRVERAGMVYREQSVLFPVDGHLLRGQIDLWFDEGGERLLMDYKTDEVSGAEAAERARDYELQLQLYALAIEQGAGRRPDHAVLYFLRPGVPVSIALAGGALDRARDTVHAFFAAQSGVEFPLRVESHCLRCPHYRGLCPAKLSGKTPERPQPVEAKLAGRAKQLPLPFGGASG